ncbi:MAG TPA: TIGR04290 family methyltransferase [Terriglobales bacterium]|nr:TIGR04290 family methyltransferase [Terriglobales bacterium]
MATIQTNFVGEGTSTRTVEQEQLSHRISELGEWFHNIDLHGVPTAPEHFLGDFPRVKWKQIAPAIPLSLEGASVLDIGCNAGFYSVEFKSRGAGPVLGVDVDDRYLRQARFVAEELGYDIEFEKLSAYDVDQVPGQFDYVLFLGVFYHLRYPLYALDKIIKKVRGRLVFQTMVRGSMDAPELRDDYHFWNKEIFEASDFPRMYFVEKCYAGDPTNWWIPNRGAVEAMLRSSGLEIESHPEAETWICRPAHVQRDGKYILDHELAGTL